MMIVIRRRRRVEIVKVDKLVERAEIVIVHDSVAQPAVIFRCIVFYLTKWANHLIKYQPQSGK